jgi:hypothetical protein
MIAEGPLCRSVTDITFTAPWEPILKDANPFLVTRDGAVKVDVESRSITVSVSGDVSDYHSSTLYRHANGSDYTVVSVFLNSRPEG